MRIRIVFGLKNRGAEVPFHHQHLLSQMIKGVIMSDSASEFAQYENYNFSGLKGQTKISRKGLHFYSSKITMVFSCFDKDFIDHFLTLLFSFPEITIGNIRISPEAVELEELSLPLSNEVKFVCISPIILSLPQFQNDTAKEFIHPETDKFSDLLYESTMQRMEQSNRFGADEISTFYQFQLTPDKAYLNKITNQKKKFARIYPLLDKDIKYEVRGYTFPFTLYAKKKVQEFIFHSGLGQFTHKGFGMIDIADNQFHKTISDYALDQLYSRQ